MKQYHREMKKKWRNHIAEFKAGVVQFPAHDMDDVKVKFLSRP